MEGERKGREGKGLGPGNNQLLVIYACIYVCIWSYVHVYNEQGLGPDNNQLLVTFDDEEDDGTPIRLVESGVV